MTRPRWWLLLLLGVVIGVGIVALFPKRVENFPEWNPQIVLELARKGYTLMETRKRPLDAVSLPGVSTTLHGAGVAVRPDSMAAWPDSLPVEVAVVEHAGQPWIGAWVNGVPVAWTEAPRIRWPEAPGPSPVSAIVEYSLTEPGGSFGLGASWEPVGIASLHAGPAVTVDTGADWAALSLRISHRYGPLSVGGQVGYQIGDSPGLHAGVSAGLAVDLN